MAERTRLAGGCVVRRRVQGSEAIFWPARQHDVRLYCAFCRARELLAKSGRPQTGKIMMRGKDYVHGDAINRYGALANLVFNGPHLFATLMGSGWLDRLAVAYPSAPALLFHSYFALAVREEEGKGPSVCACCLFFASATSTVLTRRFLVFSTPAPPAGLVVPATCLKGECLLLPVVTGPHLCVGVYECER